MAMVLPQSNRGEGEVGVREKLSERACYCSSQCVVLGASAVHFIRWKEVASTGLRLCSSRRVDSPFQHGSTSSGYVLCESGTTYGGANSAATSLHPADDRVQ